MNPKLIPIKDIEFILLDMDGTLLDKYFDDYFWRQLAPEAYAKKNGISIEAAKQALFDHYKRHENTLNWFDIDFWSKAFDMDMMVLKKQIEHLIEVHPHVEEFLSLVKRDGKKIFMVTNAHYKAIDLKFKKTQIGVYFDQVVSAFDMGTPKEDTLFWEKAEEALGFDRNNSLLVDDTIDVLRSAKAFGIRYIVLKGIASSQDDMVHSHEFPTIADFRELMYVRD